MISHAGISSLRNLLEGSDWWGQGDTLLVHLEWSSPSLAGIAGKMQVPSKDESALLFKRACFLQIPS